MLDMGSQKTKKEGIVHITLLLGSLFFFLGLFYPFIIDPARNIQIYVNQNLESVSYYGYIVVKTSYFYPLFMFVFVGIMLFIPLLVWSKFHKELEEHVWHYLFIIHVGGFPYFIQNSIGFFIQVAENGDIIPHLINMSIYIVFLAIWSQLSVKGVRRFWDKYGLKYRGTG